MKKKIFSTVAFFFLVIVSPAFANHRMGEIDTTLSENDIANMVQPAVVRIVHHITGTITIPNGDINLVNLTITPYDKKETMDMEVDEYMQGSGFLVDGDGYIVTNTHVISPEVIKEEYLRGIVSTVLMLGVSQATPEEMEKMSEYSKEEIKAFGDKIYDYLESNGSSDLKSEIRVFVESKVATSTGKEGFEAIFNEGIPAEVVYKNEKIFSDEDNYDDVGVIKIDKQYSAGLKVISADTLPTGTRVFVAGYPTNAQLEVGDFQDSTFTSGIIGSEKQLGTSRVWQIDAKISGGSSGGPMVDKEGNVIGLISFQKRGKQGDNFAFAVKTPLVLKALEEKGVQNSEGQYQQLMREGILLQRQRHCKAALEKFNAAKEEAAFTGKADKYVGGYIKECEALIASGASIDTKWDEFVEWISGVDTVVWIIVAVVVFLIILLVVLVIVFRAKIRREEKEIDELESIVLRDHSEYHSETGGVSQPQQQPASAQGVPDETENTQQQPVLKTGDMETDSGNYTALTGGADEGHSVTSDKNAHQGEEAGQSFVSTAQGVQSTTLPIPPELASYVAQSRSMGFSDEVIKAELKKAGWRDDQIAAALSGGR